MHRRLLVGLLALSVCVGMVARCVRAQSVSADEVKAAFLFNFTKFVQWPADALPVGARSFVIGVLDDDPVADSLREIIRGKTVDGRDLHLKRVSPSDDLAQLQMLFIGKSDSAGVLDLVTRMGGIPVLTVADSAGFCVSGGIVQFNTDHNQVQFEINLASAQRSRLVVSSKLLTLATIVHTTKATGGR
jgi:uncharacterized protein DUF4154